MDKAQLEQLEMEAAVGKKAAHAYEDFIGPFMVAKREDLFTAFQDVSIESIDVLTEVKRQLLVLNTLDQEIKTIIETGKLAARTLSQTPQSKH